MERILCFELLLLRGLLTDWDSTLWIFLLLKTAYLVFFLSTRGGFGGAIDWFFACGYLFLLFYTKAKLLVFRERYFEAYDLLLLVSGSLESSLRLGLGFGLSIKLFVFLGIFLAGDWASYSKSSSKYY